MPPNSIPLSLPPRSRADWRWLWLSYASAPLLTALALMVRLSMGNGHGPVLLIMLLPVLIVAYRGGVGPGILCTVLSAGTSAYYLLEPYHSLRIADPVDRIDWYTLIASGMLVGILSESMLRARRHVEGANVRLRERMLMLNQTFGGLFVWEWNGPITFWNSTAAKLYGYSEEEAVGRISHELLRTTTAKGMANVLTQLEHAGVWEGELCHLTHDGRPLTIKSRMLLVRDRGRSFVVEANDDVTESHAAELVLARSQQRFETAFRLSPLGELVVRLSDDRIIEVNESYAKLIGCAGAEIVGKTLAEHDPLLDIKILPEVRRSLEDARAITGIDVRFHRKNGDVGTGVLYAEELQGAPDRHALLVLNDVTTRQLAEDKLKLANYDLQQFAYAAAHDLQEPARNISTALGQFNRSYRTTLEPDAIELIGDSIEAAKRMNQMIRDLLAFTHADRETSLKEARVDANQTLRHALHHLKLPIAECDAEITAMELPEVQMQPTHLLQLFQNLVGNALKYRSADVPPRIQIAAKLDGSTWTFSIADNGIGFNEAFSEQIFGVFKRLHTTEDYSGNGIGLAICERIVRLYGGNIWAESVPGKGSIFFFTLPAADFAVPASTHAMQTSANYGT